MSDIACLAQPLCIWWMKRTISHEAEAAVHRLRDLGFTPASAGALPSQGGLSPLVVLGLADASCWQQVRQAFVGRLRQFPPEQFPEEFVIIVDAYKLLKRQFQSAQEEADGSGQGKRRRKMEEPGVSFAPQHVVTLVMDCAGVVHGNAPRPMASSTPTVPGIGQVNHTNGFASTGAMSSGWECSNSHTLAFAEKPAKKKRFADDMWWHVAVLLMLLPDSNWPTAAASFGPTPTSDMNRTLHKRTFLGGEIENLWAPLPLLERSLG